MEVSELNTRRDALIRKITDAIARLENGDKSITYQSISDMRSALALLDNEIMAASGVPRSRTMRFIDRSGL